uniref:Uncharacterized protein n=1 Tax=Arundo donax TaxID=35708 RepID=A0A0A9B240_ARUDO
MVSSCTTLGVEKAKSKNSIVYSTQSVVGPPCFQPLYIQSCSAIPKFCW